MELECRWIDTTCKALCIALPMRIKVPKCCHLFLLVFLVQDQNPPPLSNMSKNSCFPVVPPHFIILQPTQSQKSLCSTNPTCDILKLLLTTSWFPFSWAQTRVSPRDSNSSFMAEDSSDWVTLTESFPKGVSTAQILCLYIHSESRFCPWVPALFLPLHEMACPSPVWGQDCSCPFDACQSHLFHIYFVTLNFSQLVLKKSWGCHKGLPFGTRLNCGCDLEPESPCQAPVSHHSHGAWN